MSILIDEWSTMGRMRRPHISDLLRLCLSCGEISAASYIYKEILSQDEIGPEQVNQVLDDLPSNIWGLGKNNERLVHEDEFDYSSYEDDLVSKMDEQSQQIEIHDDSESSEMSINTDVLHGRGPIPPKNLIKVNHIPYNHLAKISNNFQTLIGSRFSEVYLGITEKSGHKIAIKKLKFDESRANICMANEQMMNNEIEQLPLLKHPNIIDLLGYSNNQGIS